MDLAGKVVIRLPHQVCVQRPLVAEQLFANKSAAQVQQMVGLLYSLCGQAQQVASALALWGKAPEGLTAVALEAIREHALFLSQLEPRLSQALKGIATWSRLPREAQDSKVQQLLVILGIEGESLPDFHAAKVLLAEKLLEKWPSKAPESTLNHYEKDFSAEILQSMAHRPRWCVAPQVQGVRENSFYTRAAHYEDLSPNVMGRVVARLWDIWQWAQIFKGRTPVFPVWGVFEQDDWRLGWVETARGRLYHAAQIDGETVVHYRISAPTEWNFHPQGILAQWLNILDEVNVQTALNLAQLIDPCVAVEVKEMTEQDSSHA